MKKILFGITSLTLGGAERVLVDIANELCDKYDITIFTIYANGDLEKQLNNKIKLKSLYNERYLELSKLNQKLIAPLKVLLFKKYIYNKRIKGNYDVEIAFLEGPITRLFSVKNTKTKKIVWIHNDIGFVFGNGIKAKLKRVIDARIYSKYQTLVFVSKDNLKRFSKIYPDIKTDKKVIYNYIDKNNILKKSNMFEPRELNSENKNFLTVARLVPQKGIDRLIKVHRQLIKQGMKHFFYVIGDGPEKEKLKKMIEKNNVKDTFILLGKRENPYPYIKKTDYFCLLSKFEGYGMVLEEAKILDKPIIITNTAAIEAIEGYNNSIVLENETEKIYQGIKKVIEEGFEKIKIDKKYDNKDILKQIEKVIEG